MPAWMDLDPQVGITHPAPLPAPHPFGLTPTLPHPTPHPPGPHHFTYAPHHTHCLCCHTRTTLPLHRTPHLLPFAHLHTWTHTLPAHTTHTHPHTHFARHHPFGRLPAFACNSLSRVGLPIEPPVLTFLHYTHILHTHIPRTDRPHLYTRFIPQFGTHTRCYTRGSLVTRVLILVTALMPPVTVILRLHYGLTLHATTVVHTHTHAHLLLYG